MTRQDVLKRFCQLSDDVMTKVFMCRVAADCFCRKDKHFNFSAEVVKFIEEAVREKIDGK